MMDVPTFMFFISIGHYNEDLTKIFICYLFAVKLLNIAFTVKCYKLHFQNDFSCKSMGLVWYFN